MWCGSNVQQLSSFNHSGVVDCLDVDVVVRHYDVTDLSILLCICKNIPSTAVIDGLCGGSRNCPAIGPCNSINLKEKV